MLCLTLTVLCGCGAKGNTESKSSKPLTDIVSLDGKYQDTVSRRATATVEVTGNNSAIITVVWGSSAYQATIWTMTASLAADGTLGYSNERQYDLITEEDGSQTEQEEYSGKSGYFKVENKDLLWLGAANKKCRKCRFVKIK